ncbi:predicted permease [Vibrio sp. JCM 19236]|nr:predicted permease [Vibrio sp. JCM 19236]
MFKILDLYIGRTIIATSSICLVTLVACQALSSMLSSCVR